MMEIEVRQHDTVQAFMRCLFISKKKKKQHTKNKNFSVDKMEGVCCPGSMLTIQC